MRATMYGCEIVCSAPIGSAASSYARACSSCGTNSSRGTRPIAASTRSSSMPRARSCCSTIAARSANAGVGEVLEHSGCDVGDALDRSFDADGEQWDDRIARDERAVASAARVVAAADVDELPARRRGDEQLARVRIREGAPAAIQRIRVIEDRPVAARRPTVRIRPEAKLLSLAARDGVASLEPQRRLDRRLDIERAREG